LRHEHRKFSATNFILRRPHGVDRVNDHVPGKRNRTQNTGLDCGAIKRTRWRGSGACFEAWPVIGGLGLS
jgi:hypothetical protein